MKRARDGSQVERGLRRGVPALARSVAAGGALASLVPSARACPSCSLSQGVDTLVYVAAFMIIPYLVVMGTWFWIKRLLASERDG